MELLLLSCDPVRRTQLGKLDTNCLYWTLDGLPVTSVYFLVHVERESRCCQIDYDVMGAGLGLDMYEHVCSVSHCWVT